MTSSRGRLAWLCAGLVSAVTAIGLAGTGVWYAAAYRQHLHSVTKTASYAGRPDLVTVQLTDGNITIVSGSPGRVAVTRNLVWSGGEPSVDEQWNGHALTIRQDCPTGWNETCEMNYTVAVPPGVALALQTDSGDIATDDSQAPQTHASSDSGDIALDFAAPPDSVYANSSSGDVTIKVPPGGTYAIDDQSANGDAVINVQHNPAAPRSITAISDDGNITVGYN
jgi:hypothetical protein